MSTALALVEWTDDGRGGVPVFYDRRRRLVDALHDFVESIAAAKRDVASPTGYRSAVDPVTYALLGWLRFLDVKGLDLWAATDALLVEHRDNEVKVVMQSPRAKQEKRLAMRTVNDRLRWIYRFYAWCRRDALLGVAVLGLKGPVTSTLCEPAMRTSQGKPKRDPATDYPKCFKRVSGRGSGKQHFATSEEKRRLIEALTNSDDAFVRERNRLWVELTDRVGWRAVTLTGLEVDDFSPNRSTELDDGNRLVSPKVQKFGYGDSFEVPATLFARVTRFIAAREVRMKQKGWSEAVSQRRLFTSATSGRPLGDQTIVQAFGKAYRAIGVPARQGAGHHSLRRKFGDGAAVQELQSRKELGLSTAAEDVMHATARKLGQRSIASQTPYQRAVRSGTREATVAKLSQKVEEQSSVIADQDEEIRRLRLEVERAKAGLHT